MTSEQTARLLLSDSQSAFGSLCSGACLQPTNILIEDKASGTQLIPELIQDGVYGVTQYEPTMDKIMRMHSVTSTIENEFRVCPYRGRMAGCVFAGTNDLSRLQI